MRSLDVIADGATLAASYSPAGDAAIVAIHGASEGTRRFVLYEHLHEVLPSSGIGVVTFDRRGEGASDGEPSVGRFELQVRDCLDVLASIDVARLGLWGFSQGGWVAPLVVERRPDLACVVTVASCGVSPYHQMLYGVARHLADGGYREDVVARVLDLRHRVAAAMRGDAVDEDALDAELRACVLEPWHDLAYLPASLPGARARAAWVAEMDFDPRPSLAGIRCPVLAFYGDDDEWTPVRPSVEAWGFAQPDARVEVLSGVGHALCDREGRPDPRYGAILVEWLGERLGVG